MNNELIFKAVEWDNLPDFDLYMDQLLTYIEKHCAILFTGDERIITASMINNYVKIGLIKRPNGKKYDREQIAQLIMIIALKRVMPLDSIRNLLIPFEENDFEKHYRNFCSVQTDIQKTFNASMTDSALQNALTASAYSLLSIRQINKNNDKETEK